jgi:prefoldin subunit 5
MKYQLFALLLCLTVSSSPVFGQSTDSLAALYQKYMDLYRREESMSQNIKTLNETLQKMDAEVKRVNELDGKVGDLSSSINSSLELVNRLTTNDILTKKSRLETQQRKIVNTAVFVGYANNSFDAIDAALAQSDYLNDVTALNNPTNTELGFSLSDEITNLLETQIIKGDKKFNGKNAEKFIKMAQSIVKDPFVATFTSAVPGLGAIEGVLGLVSNVIVKEPSVTVEDYKKFKQEMNRFIAHYDGLARANNSFSANMSNLTMRSEALRTVINGYALERVRTINPDLKTEGKELHEVIAASYTPLYLEQNVKRIVGEYGSGNNVDYTRALEDKRLVYPIYAINQAQFIKQELTALTNEYISSYRSYHKALRLVLEKSKSLSKAPQEVDKKIAALDSKLERVISTFERNVKIDNVVNSLNEIPTY